MACVPSVIRVRGARQHNLKNLDLDLPLGQLIVVTGLSGSGKSSLAFDTLFAEGQRRYIETFSPYARQFFDRMDRPQVDHIEGIPPAIAIEQRNAVKTTRSTVGTITEITDYLKVVWQHLAQLHCRQCGRPVRKETPAVIWEEVKRRFPGEELTITFTVALSAKLGMDESLGLIAKQGYQRLWLEGKPRRIEEAQTVLLAAPIPALEVVQDRLRISPANRARFAEACEQAYHFGKGRLTIRGGGEPTAFSRHLHCAQCDLEYREPSAALFSFNHPVGACPECRGFGRTITIDFDRAIPDRGLSLRDGAVRPWQTGRGIECQQDLVRMCRVKGIPVDVPFQALNREHQGYILEGDPDYGIDEEHEWPRAWYGVKGYFRWLESKAYKMHVRVLLARYRAYVTCPACEGQRFQPESLLYKVADAEQRWVTLAEVYTWPIARSHAFVEHLVSQLARPAHDPLRLALEEVRCRLQYLVEVGLEYLSLDRPTRSLSGGETERVNLTTCLGTRLVNTLYVLDEPSVGLHARDTERLVRILHRLRDAGNTVLVVEHEAGIMAAADQILDLGPGRGEQGGNLVFQGTYAQLLQDPNSLTGQYLSGRQHIPEPEHRFIRPRARSGRKANAADGEAVRWLKISRVTRHNLRDFSVAIPLQRMVCLSGVSGSGKTTLAREVIVPLLQAKLESSRPPLAAPDETAGESEGGEENQRVGTPGQIEGWESLAAVILVDQSPLGRTPRSTPAVYIGAFEALRELFASTELAQQRGLNASAFSFNSAQGQCDRCRGAGFEKVEMQFLSDVFLRCPACGGSRYRPHILEITRRSPESAGTADSVREWNIADVLAATVDEALSFLADIVGNSARRAETALRLLQEVGLGYLRLGQPINTLSGGESQRLKLVGHLAEAATSSGPARHNLFVFDEPTTGLHFDDVRILLKAFERLVEAGHSLLVIEHHLEVLKCADWIIDLGPEAGEAGGRIVVEGPPEAVKRHAASHTAAALRRLR